MDDSDNVNINANTFETWKNDFKVNHPTLHWIDNVLLQNKTILGHPPSWALTHPIEAIAGKMEDMAYEVKWAWQRVFRGWDDRVLWSIDSWLSEVMPKILRTFKEIQHGYRGNFTKEDEYVNEKGWILIKQDAEKREIENWNNDIETMIAGFTAAKMMIGIEYNGDDEYKHLEEVFKKGMTAFVDNYFSLWD